jgi:hypothetical protein
MWPIGGETGSRCVSYRADPMSFPAEIFDQITESITIVGNEKQAQGERKSARVQLRTHVTLLPWNNPANALSVRIRDLSTDGLGVLHTERLSLDDQVVICFPSGEQTIMALYTIVYWEPLAEKLYAIGAQFERLVEQSDLDARILEVTRTPAESRGPLTRLGQALVRSRKAS